MAETARLANLAAMSWARECMEQFRAGADYAEADIDELIALRAGSPGLVHTALRMYVNAVAETEKSGCAAYIRLAVPVHARHGLGVGSRPRLDSLMALDDFKGRLRGVRLPNFILSRQNPPLTHSNAGQVWRARIDLSGEPGLARCEAAFVTECWDEETGESFWEIEHFSPPRQLIEAQVTLRD